MPGSANTPPPQGSQDAPGVESPVFQILGTGTGNDGRWGEGTLPLDAQTGLPSLPLVRQATGATLSSVTASTTTGVLLAANTLRKGALFFNDSSANLFLALAATASTTAYTLKMAAGTYYELPQPTWAGVVSGLWDSANGNVRITEVI